VSNFNPPLPPPPEVVVGEGVNAPELLLLVVEPTKPTQLAVVLKARRMLAAALATDYSRPMLAAPKALPSTSALNPPGWTVLETSPQHNLTASKASLVLTGLVSASVTEEMPVMKHKM
jgi:hypothetical protein